MFGIDINQFIESYGYLSVFLGSLLEGELIVITAGAIAYTDLLYLPYVILLAFLATMIAEQIFYYVGKFIGTRFFKYFPKLNEKAELAFSLLREHQNVFILSCRFIYGIRIVSPFIIGAAKINPVRFTIMNTLAAALWSITISVLGYMSAYLSDYLNCSEYGSYLMITIFILINLFFIPKIIWKVLKQYKK